MQPRDCRDEVPNETNIIRALREDEYRADKTIRKGAFVPRTNGKDDDGLSVSEPLHDNKAALQVRMQTDSESFCVLSAGCVRGVGEKALDVCRDRTEQDPYHCLIVGVPATKTEKALANRLAEKLAECSKFYTPPE